MTATLGPRIVGPNQNRLLTVGAETDSKAGVISEEAARQLLTHGWKPYSGTAEAKNGWVVAGTDPDLNPRPIWRGESDRPVR